MKGANLMGAKLNKALLDRADLRKTNLIAAKLYGASMVETNMMNSVLIKSNLSVADLKGANCSGADLSLADLTLSKLVGTNLKDAKLYQANLFRADLSESNISGANLNDANLSRWNIKGIKCTHIIWKGKRLGFKEGEFEKAFTNIEKTIEMILDIPFSDLSHYAGGVIEQAINQKYGEGSLLFRGQVALSNHTTKYEFINFGTEEQFKELQGKLIDIQNQLKPVIEDAKAKREPKSIIDLKEEIDIPFTKGLIVRPKEVSRLLTERHAQMHPLLQKIVLAVQVAIQ